MGTHAPQQDRAARFSQRWLLADQHCLADRLPATSTSASGRRHGGRRRRAAYVAPRPRWGARRDLPRARVHRRSRGSPAGVPGRAPRRQRHAVSARAVRITGARPSGVSGPTATTFTGYCGLSSERLRTYVSSMTRLRTLMTDIAFGESPRWHDGRLWFSDWGAKAVVAVDPEGNRVRVSEGGEVLQTIELDRGC